LPMYIVYDFNTGKEPLAPRVRWAGQQNDGGGDAIYRD
jgi:hypothetical protein